MCVCVCARAHARVPACVRAWHRLCAQQDCSDLTVLSGECFRTKTVSQKVESEQAAAAAKNMKPVSANPKEILAALSTTQGSQLNLSVFRAKSFKLSAGFLALRAWATKPRSDNGNWKP